MARWMMNPDSFPALSCQERSIWLEETAEAERLEGGSGGSLPPPLPPPPLPAAHALGVIKRVTKPSAKIIRAGRLRAMCRMNFAAATAATEATLTEFCVMPH